jgi:Fe-S-cluster containining protein
MNERPPFERTTCACSDCAKCCKQQPGYLIPSDLERIAEHLGEPVGPWLVASPGALVGRMVQGQLQTFRIGSIVPRTVDGGSRCVFLTEDDKCAIHPVAPFGCAFFDTHQTDEQWQEKSSWGVHQMLDAGYQSIRAILARATFYKGKPVNEDENP